MPSRKRSSKRKQKKSNPDPGSSSRIPVEEIAAVPTQSEQQTTEQQSADTEQDTDDTVKQYLRNSEQHDDDETEQQDDDNTEKDIYDPEQNDDGNYEKISSSAADEPSTSTTAPPPPAGESFTSTTTSPPAGEPSTSTTAPPITGESSTSTAAPPPLATGDTTSGTSQPTNQRQGGPDKRFFFIRGTGEIYLELDESIIKHGRYGYKHRVRVGAQPHPVDESSNQSREASATTPPTSTSSPTTSSTSTRRRPSSSRLARYIRLFIIIFIFYSSYTLVKRVYNLTYTVITSPPNVPAYQQNEYGCEYVDPLGNIKLKTSNAFRSIIDNKFIHGLGRLQNYVPHWFQPDSEIHHDTKNEQQSSKLEDLKAKAKILKTNKKRTKKNYQDKLMESISSIENQGLEREQVLLSVTMKRDALLNEKQFRIYNTIKEMGNNENLVVTLIDIRDTITFQEAEKLPIYLSESFLQLNNKIGEMMKSLENGISTEEMDYFEDYDDYNI
ncbi:hypothetical protein BDA99DRAFT_534394 [Phascolomyces articulosus]|uniref:Uncharacterized protein n=1 Tax=Phascolomyces articulosus TaxID=60185 RepID=A0AAD5K6W9_9FUNG|nr:hypothetical protein BDA99DRAFT_534394 [Phascolomyces articulosus]